MTSQIATLDDVREIFQGINDSIFYVTNDANHGVGLERMLKDYGIVCIDDNAVTRYMEEAGLNIFSLEKELGDKNIIFRSSEQLLGHEKAAAFLRARGQANLLFFKTSASIEQICQKNGWRVLASPSRLGRYFENKLHFQEVLKELGIASPPGEEVALSPEIYGNLRRRYGEPLVVQFAKGFGGNRTFLIEDESQFATLAEGDLNKRVRVSRYLKGYNLTINACVTQHGIVVGDLFYQITGLPECTTYRLGSCGNDWLYPPLPAPIRYQIFEQTRIIGEYMMRRGYRGIFGLDFVVDAQTGEVFVIENNARLVASIPMFTKLQIDGNEIPLLALHLLEFLRVDYEIEVNRVNESVQQRKRGAQLILHNLEGASAEVRGDFRPGIYIQRDGELVFQRPAYCIEGCQSEDEFLVLAVDQGRLVNPNIECARIQARRTMLQPDYRPADWALAVARSVYRGLDLRLPKSTRLRKSDQFEAKLR